MGYKNRDDMYLAKAAGENVDVTTITPPVPVSDREKLYLKLDERLSEAEEGTGGSGGGTLITCEMSAPTGDYPFVITNMDKVCDALDAIRENPVTASQYAVLVNSTIGSDFPSTLYTFVPYLYIDEDETDEIEDHIRVSCYSSSDPEEYGSRAFVVGGEWIVNGSKLCHYNMRVAGDWWFDRDAIDENGTLAAYAIPEGDQE